MADTDLIFALGPATTADLVFGETEGALANKGTISFALGLPVVAFEGDDIVPPTNDATILFSLGLPTVSITGGFNLGVERPVVGSVGTTHQIALPLPAGVQAGHRDGLGTIGGAQTHHTRADPLRPGVQSFHEAGAPLRNGPSAHHTEADPLRAGTRNLHGAGLSTRSSQRTLHTEGDRRRATARTAHQERYRDRRPALRLRHTEADALIVQHQQLVREGLDMSMSRWHRHQEAMKPPAGMYVPPQPPLPEPCYTPDPNLLFSTGYSPSKNLVFFCENHDEPPPPDGNVVVPVRSVYIVLNDVYLKRVVGNVMLPARSFSLSIDVDSWTWSFSASLPIQALSDVEPISGVPVELEAGINGSAYRLLVEQITSERQFGNHSIRVSGRGKSALLASPYAPIMSFANSTQRTAQQLMADVLTLNGVPLGWDIDWQLTDWLVPAGVFGMQGSYMDGLLAISGAAGAYIRPHPTDQELSVLLRYPALPWTWGSVTPDFVLPSAVAARESIEWKDLPLYNRVYVSGQGSGILGRVTRAGTDGALLAPMVTDALITEAAAARQRGESILANVGRQAIVGLGLPVLEETGVIVPGNFIRYEDPVGNRTGIVRATTVDVSGGGANVKQSLQVETYE